MAADDSHPTGKQEAAEQEAVDEQVVELAHRLFDLAREGRAQELAAYLDAGAPVELTDPKGNTLLMLGAYHGHPDVVRELAARGADVDRRNDRNQPPLAGAVFKGEDAVIEVLLATGADVHAGTPSAVETARFFGHDELADRLTAAD